MLWPHTKTLNIFYKHWKQKLQFVNCLHLPRMSLLRLTTISFLQKPNIGHWNANNPQIEPISFIPDKPSSRQGKSLDYEWENGPLVVSCKMPEFFEKSPLSGAGKQPNFQVTLCLRFVSTDVKFDDWWMHQISNICRKTNIFIKIFTNIGLSNRRSLTYLRLWYCSKKMGPIPNHSV